MTDNPGPRMGLHNITPSEARRLERREWLADRDADQRHAEEQNRRLRMSEYKTALGDRVPRFPGTKSVREQIAEVRNALVAAFEEAEKAAALQRRMDASAAQDQSRFPVLDRGGDGR